MRLKLSSMVYVIVLSFLTSYVTSFFFEKNAGDFIYAGFPFSFLTQAWGMGFSKISPLAYLLQPTFWGDVIVWFVVWYLIFALIKKFLQKNSSSLS